MKKIPDNCPTCDEKLDRYDELRNGVYIESMYWCSKCGKEIATETLGGKITWA